jgi:predicted metal-binding protein
MATCEGSICCFRNLARRKSLHHSHVHILVTCGISGGKGRQRKL